MTTETAAKDWNDYPKHEIQRPDVAVVREDCLWLLKALRRVHEAKAPGRFPNYPRHIDVETIYRMVQGLERTLNRDGIPFGHERHSWINLDLAVSYGEDEEVWLALNWLRKVLDALMSRNSWQFLAESGSACDSLEGLEATSFQADESIIRELRKIVALFHPKILKSWSDEYRDKGVEKSAAKKNGAKP